MKTNFENKSNKEIFEYLRDIKGDTRFNQEQWNLLCLEIFRRLCQSWEKDVKIEDIYGNHKENDLSI